MKTTADTSVLVAAFASWHEHHASASGALARVDGIVTHCLLETFSVLTRLPAPHRMAPDVVATFLDETFGDLPLYALPAAEQRALIGTCIANGIAGGAVYDALIAATCTRSSLRLLTLDARARPTYALLSAVHEMLV